ncbi:MAG: hypothetical protein ACRD1T_11195, partial [Acidimicrobiia bacterium]
MEPGEKYNRISIVTLLKKGNKIRPKLAFRSRHPSSTAGQPAPVTRSLARFWAVLCMETRHGPQIRPDLRRFLGVDVHQLGRMFA